MANEMLEKDKKRKKMILAIILVLAVIVIIVFGILFTELSKYIWPEVETPVNENNGYQLSKDGTVTIDGITYKQKDDGNFLVLSAEKTISNIDIRSKINETDEVVVNEIGEKAFEGCTNLTILNISSTITKIGDYAFSGCNQLSTITIPYSVTEIGNSCFYECNSLSSIKVAVANEHFTSENGILYDIDRKKLYVYPYSKTDEEYKLSDTLESIENNAFRGFEKLKTVSLPESLTNIGDGAFENCINLDTVLICKNVTSIGSNAFSNCSTSLIIYGEKGSYAETYAKENNITFKSSSEMPIKTETNNNTTTNTNNTSVTDITGGTTNTSNVLRNLIEIQ